MANRYIGILPQAYSGNDTDKLLANVSDVPKLAALAVLKQYMNRNITSVSVSKIPSTQDAYVVSFTGGALVMKLPKGNGMTDITFDSLDNTKRTYLVDLDDGTDREFYVYDGVGVYHVSRTATAQGDSKLVDEYTVQFTGGLPSRKFYVTNGTGIQSLIKTSGSGDQGTFDTYTITFNDNGQTPPFTFQIWNGYDGTKLVETVCECYPDSNKNITIAEEVLGLVSMSKSQNLTDAQRAMAIKNLYLGSSYDSGDVWLSNTENVQTVVRRIGDFVQLDMVKAIRGATNLFPAIPAGFRPAETAMMFYKIYSSNPYSVQVDPDGSIKCVWISGTTLKESQYASGADIYNLSLFYNTDDDVPTS